MKFISFDNIEVLRKKWQVRMHLISNEIERSLLSNVKTIHPEVETTFSSSSCGHPSYLLFLVQSVGVADSAEITNNHVHLKG
jgi:hypothetical protein